MRDHQLHHVGLLMVGRVLVGTQNDGVTKNSSTATSSEIRDRAKRHSTERGVAEFCAAKLRSEGIPFPTHASAEGVEAKF